MIFFFAFPVSSGKLGKQSLRFRAAKTFFFDIPVFLYQNEIPAGHGPLETILCFPEYYYTGLKPSPINFENCELSLTCNYNQLKRSANNLFQWTSYQTILCQGMRTAHKTRKLYSCPHWSRPRVTTSRLSDSY